MSFKPKFRFPKKYDDTVLQPILNKVYDDINAVARDARDIADRIRPTLESLERQFKETVLTTLFRGEFYQVNDAGTIYAEGRIVPVSGAQAANQLRARSSAGGNIEEGDAWTTLDSSDWITDVSYPMEGYYRYRHTLQETARDSDLVAMQLQARNSGSNVMWLNAVHTFDINTLPELRQFKVSVGNFNYATEKWRIYVTWEGDEDFGSIGIGYGTSAYNTDDDLVTDLDTGDVYDNTRAKSGAFIFEGDPATQYYFVARAYSGASGSGESGAVVYRDDVFTPPNLSTGDYLNDDVITSQMLVDVQKRAYVNIVMEPDGSSPHDTVKYNGTIQIAGDTTYTMAPADQTIDMSSDGGLWYFYFDPASDANSLIATTSAATAKAQTGSRLLVGVGKKASSTTERAFYVVTGEQPVITAPVINVVQLSALTANVGTLTAGVIKNTDYDTNGGVYLDLTSEGLSFTTPTSAPGGTDPQVLLWEDSGTEVLKVFAWMSGGNPLSVIVHPQASGTMAVESQWDMTIDAANDMFVVAGADLDFQVTGDIIMASLPTSATGLPTGALWNDSGTLKVA